MCARIYYLHRYGTALFGPDGNIGRMPFFKMTMVPVVSKGIFQLLSARGGALLLSSLELEGIVWLRSDHQNGTQSAWGSSSCPLNASPLDMLWIIDSMGE